MAQVKIYGHAGFLHGQQLHISDAIHAASMQVLGLPEGKRFHRFFPLAAEDFIHPADRSTAYLILEIHLFRGVSQRHFANTSGNSRSIWARPLILPRTIWK